MLIMFVFCLFFIVYTFVGYPALLLFLTKGKKSLSPVSVLQNKTIDVVLVVCNEEKNIHRKLDNIFAMDYPQDLVRVIVVDDCSNDGTAVIVAQYPSEKITLIKNSVRSGKAHGLNSALREASAELIFFVDARQIVTSNALRDLSAWFSDGSDVGAVSGELLFRDEGRNDVSEGIDAYARYERFIRSSEAISGSVPGVSGAVYMLRRDLFRPIPDDTILDDVAIPMNAIQAGYTVKYDARVIAYDVPSNDIKREKQRKIRTIKGNYQALFRNLHWCIPSMHPAWFAYLSHKVTRLLAPFFALISLLIACAYGLSGYAAGYIYALAVVVFLLSYPVSLIIPAIMRVSVLRIASAFVALNWFNLLGFYHYCFGEKVKNWK